MLGMGLPIPMLNQRGKGGPPPTPMQLKARAILASFNAATPIGVLSSPPSITSGGAYANSTINGNAWNAAQLGPTSSSITNVVGGLPVDAGGGLYTPRWMMGVLLTLVQGGQEWAPTFTWTGQACDIGYFAYTGNAVYHIWVQVTETGQPPKWHAATPYNPAINDEAHYIKFDFGTVATRTVKFFLDGFVLFTGFNCDGTIASAPSYSLLAIDIGDSYSFDTTSPDTFRFGLPSAASQSSGIFNYIESGTGSQGIVTPDPTTGRTTPQRIPTDLLRLGTPDYIQIHGSVNDTLATAPTIQSGMAAYVTAVQNAAPNAFIVALSSYTSTNRSISGAQNNAFRDGALSTADSSRTLVIDTVAAGFPTILSGGGDGIHPSAAEVVTINNLITPLVVAWLGTKT